MRTPTEILTDLQAAVADVERLQVELSDAVHATEFTLIDRAIFRACRVWNMSPKLIKNGCRSAKLSMTRFFAWMLLHNDGWSDGEIAHAFHKERSTVSYGLHKLADLLETDKEIQEKWKLV